MVLAVVLPASAPLAVFGWQPDGCSNLENLLGQCLVKTPQVSDGRPHPLLSLHARARTDNPVRFCLAVNISNVPSTTQLAASWRDWRYGAAGFARKRAGLIGPSLEPLQTHPRTCDDIGSGVDRWPVGLPSIKCGFVLPHACPCLSRPRQVVRSVLTAANLHHRPLWLIGPAGGHCS